MRIASVLLLPARTSRQRSQARCMHLVVTCSGVVGAYTRQRVEEAVEILQGLPGHDRHQGRLINAGSPKYVSWDHCNHNVCWIARNTNFGIATALIVWSTALPEVPESPQQQQLGITKLPYRVRVVGVSFDGQFVNLSLYQ